MQPTGSAKKKPYTALMLSLGMPGLGQIYLGQGELGAFLYLLPNVLVVVCFLFTDVVGILLSLLFLFVVYFYATLRAYYDAKSQRGAAGPKVYNHPMVYLALWLVHLAFTLWLTDPSSYLGRHVVIRGFRARSIAMEPAILRGDLVFSFRRPFDTLDLAPGELVVVREPPPNERYQLRRVVGVPGDVIEARDGMMFRNGRPLRVVPCDEAPAFGREGFLYFRETNEPHTYFTSHTPGSSFRSGRWTVPHGSWFVMADRRFQFDDSVVWGPVEGDAVLGRVAFIVWPRGTFSRFGPPVYADDTSAERSVRQVRKPRRTLAKDLARTAAQW